ncbi:DUF7167 family protein [Aneurinibacillus aneurinilyticus]|uniref:DUF7167 family protein n=1 Tax=Aneurinibacillus aneurinilyticus TaxID=1391 RepID=UPI00352448FC
MPKYEFRVSTGYVGCKRTEIVEIDEDELTGKTEEEIEEYQEWRMRSNELFKMQKRYNKLYS